MAEDNDLEVETPEGEEPEAPQRQDAAYWQRKAEKAERRLRRIEKFSELQSKHPGASLEDFKGVETTEWERLAARLYQQPQAPQGQQDEAQVASSTQAPQVPPEEQAAMQRFASTAAGTAPAPPKKLTIEEADKLPWPERRNLIAAGLVEGVTPPQ